MSLSSTSCVTVIVVTWNSAATIVACLDSLQTCVFPGATETILFDNASSDGTADLVAGAYPAITLIRSADNLGFARANNRAMAIATSAHILLLNPDTVLADPSAIAGMLEVLDARPDIAMLGPRLVFADGSHQVGDGGFRPSTLNMICHGLGIAHVLPGIRTLYLVRPDRYPAQTQSVDWICGACLMLRRDAFQSAGGMDEQLFLYAEDVEWGCRWRDRGLGIAYLPHTSVMHLQGHSEAQTGAAVSTRWLTSLLDLYVRLNGRRWHGVVCASFAAGFLLRAVAYTGLRFVRPTRADHYVERAAALVAYARAATGHSAVRAKS